MTLELLPGTHSLLRGISISYINSFIMSSLNATIICKRGLFTDFSFSRVQHVSISGISIISCGRADFHSVGSLNIDSSSIDSQFSLWNLENVNNASIISTSFLDGQVGPALLVDRSSLLVKFSKFINTTTSSDSSLRGSKCLRGAAIHCSTSSLNVIQSIFSQNGIECTFIGEGGAIYTYSTNVNITDSIFTDNMALCSGGALFTYYGSLLILNSLFSNNSANTGGALYVYNYHTQFCLHTE